MMTKLDISNYKVPVLKIWERFKDLPLLNEDGCDYRKSPLLPKTVNQNSIMFIGINPSFNTKFTIPLEDREIGFYPELTTSGKDIPYFEKFKDIANYCEEDWTHLDMLFLRERNQKLIEKLSYNQDGILFLNEQLKISFEIVEKAKPKIIIISNAFVSEFFGKKKTKHKSLDKIWKGFNLEFDGGSFDNKIGTYRLKFGDAKIPVILSGMLSGQRALDIGSFERLKWQIKMILQRVNDEN